RCCPHMRKLCGSAIVPEKMGMRGLCLGLSNENHATAPTSSGSHERHCITCEYEHPAMAIVRCLSMVPGLCSLMRVRMSAFIQLLMAGDFTVSVTSLPASSFFFTVIIRFFVISYGVPS